jgi:preprotein translocase subunit YajC
MFWNLLTSADPGSGDKGGNSGSLTFLFIMIAIIVLFMFWNRQSQKKREQEINNKLDAIKPGDKVTTIGYVCGTVVEVCPEENTLVLETGSETAGKSYIKIDRRAVYYTNAGESNAVATEEGPAEGETFFEEAPVTEEVVEEAPVTEETVEETAEEE